MSNSNEISKRRQFVATAESSPYWASINLLSFFLCVIDFKYGYIPSFSFLKILGNLFLIIEMCLMFNFFINFVYNMYLILWIKKLMQPMELTVSEFNLFGIGAKEIGFKLKKEESSKTVTPIKKVTNTPQSTPTFEINSSSILDKHASLDSTTLSNRLFDSSLNSTSSSWSFIRPNSDSFSKLRNSPDLFKNNSGNELKFRKSNSFLFNKKKSSISSESELKRYLTEHEERTEHINELIQAQKRFTSVTDGSSHMNQAPNSPHFIGQKSETSLTHSPVYSPKNQSFGSPFNKSQLATISTSPLSTSSITSNLSQMPNNCQEVSNTAVPTYQPAIKVVTLPTNPEKSESINYSHSSTKSLEKILTKLEIDDSRLNQMVENIRKWISQTILVRLSEEIDLINKLILEKGFIDSLIGETSIQQLKQLAKKLEFSTLEQLCSFLDINVRNIENNSTLQQYLVRRIKDLAKGGCITEFHWEGGGSYNYKHWKEDMLTDSEIILHLFCVYMDSRLLFNPTIPEGKPFTSQHLKLTKSDSPRSDTFIHQLKQYPPHYSLSLKGENFDLPPGRNNLFYTLLVFLNHIKVKNFGLLGRINLGPSGLNIAWVIDK
ncbi:hypothetical protein RDWZM_007585 [Blomia tropicalis]|uniref:Transmembrane protein 209 n=1 Tax=Blomia tropicalis TaxID=40697 RepID=A0A9Q0RI46_BLOTA|nr:hypothetical protein RDWZM_007585 [Blomia tropicalis]